MQFDPMLVALLDKLRAQVFGGGGGGYANGTISYAPRFWTERDALHGLQAELATGTAPIMDHRAGEGPDYRRRLRNARRHRRAVVR